MTLKVMSRAGRITQAGHIMTIVRNVAGQKAADEVGRIRLLNDRASGQDVSPSPCIWARLRVCVCVCVFEEILAVCSGRSFTTAH